MTVFKLILLCVVVVITAAVTGIRVLQRNYFRFRPVLRRITTILWLFILSVLAVIIAIQYIF